MPIQHTVFGKPISIPMLPRRMIVLFGSIIFFSSCLLFLGGSSGSDGTYHYPTPGSVKDSVSKTLNDWSKNVHKRPPPPPSANSSSGDSSWLPHWKWKNPFSSAITLDENRALLPPLPNRPRVYTYYDVTNAKDKHQVEAENELLLIWRRAWWAQGFSPQVLGPSEATNSKHYQALGLMDLDPDVKEELMRWLAWDHMGTGILANYLALPMASYDDDMLSFLRRGEFPILTRFEGLGNALFCGEGKAVSASLMTVFKMAAPPKPGKRKHGNKEESHKFDSIFDAIGEKFGLDKRGNSIAWYNAEIIEKSYPNVQEELETKRPANGYFLLAKLINSHLHTTWQNTFSKGLEVVKPFGEDMTVVVEPAIDLARNLTQCPATPEPKSCPPNNKKCTPCSESKPNTISLSATFTNKTSAYTIGSCVHPYTLQALIRDREELNVKFIRRRTKRDAWLAEVMAKITPEGVSGSARVVEFKDAVASDYGSSASLWMTAERETHKDLNWIFGFEIPQSINTTITSAPKTPQGLELPLPGERPPMPQMTGPAPHPLKVKNQRVLLAKARDLIHNSVRQVVKLREAVEAWNLADTEAWKFARAYSARRRVERLVWEEEERQFAGAEHRAEGWGGWISGKIGLGNN